MENDNLIIINPETEQEEDLLYKELQEAIDNRDEIASKVEKVLGLNGQTKKGEPVLEKLVLLMDKAYVEESNLLILWFESIGDLSLEEN